MAKQEDKRRKKAKRALAHWYAFKPICLVPIVGYLLGLVILPLQRGETLTWASLSGGLMAWAICVFVAALLGWIAWKALGRADWVANGVFAAIVALVGIWTVGLGAPQRAEAKMRVHQTVSEQMAPLKEKAHEIID